MLISSKGQYALRLMVDISINSGSTVTVKAVARRCGLSDKYLEQVTSSLLKAGYLRSVRGPRGGYRLNMPAEEITVGMVLRAIEGRISPIDNLFVIWCSIECFLDKIFHTYILSEPEVHLHIKLHLER